MIRKKGNRYTLYSKEGKRRLSKPGTKAKAKKRERQVQYFKNKK